MASYILGIDIGTTSVKTAVFDYSGNQVASSMVEYSLLTPTTTQVEVPCEVYMESIIQCMQNIRQKGTINTHEISVVGFSVQGETLCLLNEDEVPLKNAIVWMDNRAGEQAEMLRQRFGDEKCYEVTGQVSFEACWPVAKVLWVKQNEPEIFDKVRHILLLEDYIIHQLTGMFVSEGSLLTSTEYWDIRSKKYWNEMLDFVGIDESWLPEIRESGEIVATILPEMAEKLGVSYETKISTGCLDQAAGAIGVGNIKPGIFSENIGAALAICVPTKKLTYDPNRKMPVHYFAIPDMYMMHTFTTGGMCLRWFRDTFCSDVVSMQNKTSLDSYFLLDKEAASISPGSDGLITLPHLQGSMAPDVNLNAKGVFYGFTLKHTRAHFIRSILESLGYIINRNLEAIEDMGLEIEQIRTMGGGSKSELWNQIKSNITGKTLYTTSSAQDTACLGAAILAGCALGVFKDVGCATEAMIRINKSYNPERESNSIYKHQYMKFKVLFNSMKDLYDLDTKEL